MGWVCGCYLNFHLISLGTLKIEALEPGNGNVMFVQKGAFGGTNCQSSQVIRPFPLQRQKHDVGGGSMDLQCGC